MVSDSLCRMDHEAVDEVVAMLKDEVDDLRRVIDEAGQRLELELARAGVGGAG